MKFTLTAEWIAGRAGRGEGGSRKVEEVALQGSAQVCAPECTEMGMRVSVGVNRPELHEGGTHVSGHQASIRASIRVRASGRVSA